MVGTTYTLVGRNRSADAVRTADSDLGDCSCGSVIDVGGHIPVGGWYPDLGETNHPECRGSGPSRWLDVAASPHHGDEHDDDENHYDGS